MKSFASHLHSLGKYWQGELFGWQAEYTPESDRKPEDSKMTFTPADFYRLLRKSLNLLEETTSKNKNSGLVTHVRHACGTLWIGESGIWFFSLMWEHGKDKDPSEFLDDRGMVK